MINSRKIEDLDPRVQPICAKHIDLCRALGIELLLTSTWRDFEAQDALYAIGRTRDVKRKPVTQAKGGKSWHNYKVAWDVVPIVGGKPVWDALDRRWDDVVLCGIQAGAEAGAHWKQFPDMPHFQVIPGRPTQALSFEEAQSRFTANGSIFLA